MSMKLRFTDEAGTDYSAAVIHNPGHEGALVLDKLTGVILTPIMERPEWADGLAVALLSEHRQFYLSRTGKYNEPDLYELQDLGFVGVNEQGDEVEIYATHEFRMDRLNMLLGGVWNREEGLTDIEGALAEQELALDHQRTEGEAGAMTEAGANLTERTGTKG